MGYVLLRFLFLIFFIITVLDFYSMNQLVLSFQNQSNHQNIFKYHIQPLRKFVIITFTRNNHYLCEAFEP